jgi:hypothetical protein
LQSSLATDTLAKMNKDIGEIVRFLTARAEAKRDAAKSAADAEFQADMQSIQRIPSLGETALIATPRLAVKSTTPIRDKRLGGRKNGPTATVRAAIAKLGDGFSVASLVEYFEKQGITTVPRPAIYSALNKMTEAEEIERIEHDGKPTLEYRIVALKKVA